MSLTPHVQTQNLNLLLPYIPLWGIFALLATLRVLQLLLPLLLQSLLNMVARGLKNESQGL